MIIAILPITEVGILAEVAFQATVILVFDAPDPIATRVSIDVAVEHGGGGFPGAGDGLALCTECKDRVGDDQRRLLVAVWATTIYCIVLAQRTAVDTRI
jgi:hypothetical protein